MAISYVGQGANAGTTVTIPSHQIGDLIFIFAYRSDSSIPPGTPTAGGTVPTWTLITSAGGSTNSSNLRYAVATATNTTSGTWTNATEIICLVYRGVKRPGDFATRVATDNTIGYPALTLDRTNNTSWVVGFGASRSATDVEQAPTGMTNRASTGTEAAGHDTNGTVSSWSLQTVTVNQTTGTRGHTVELRDAALVETQTVGTFTLTGNNATFTKTRDLNPVTGTFTLTGNNAILTRTGGNELLAIVGTFGLTGNQVSLTHSHVLTCDTGTFNFTGNNVTLTKAAAASLNALVGIFTLTGNSVTLAKTSNQYAPNNQGLIEVLIDLKSIMSGETVYAVAGFTAECFETVTQGQALYSRSSDGKVGLAIANSTEDKANVIGFAQTSKLVGEIVRVLIVGILPTSGLSPGRIYYLSATTNGGISITPPNVAGQYVTRVGEAVTTGQLVVQLEPPIQLY